MVILFSILRQVNWRYYDSTPIVLLNKLMAKASPSSFWMSKGSCRAAKKVSHFRAKSSIGSSEVTLSKLFYSMTLLKIRVPGFTHFLLTLGIPQFEFSCQNSATLSVKNAKNFDMAMWFMWDYKLFGTSFLGSFSPISRGATFNDDFLALSVANEKSLFMGLNQESCCKYEVEVVALYARKNS